MGQLPIKKNIIYILSLKLDGTAPYAGLLLAPTMSTSQKPLWHLGASPSARRQVCT